MTTTYPRCEWDGGEKTANRFCSDECRKAFGKWKRNNERRNK